MFADLEKEAQILFVLFFFLNTEVEDHLLFKRPNALVGQNGLLARIYVILLITQLSYNTVSVICRVGDLQILMGL